MLSFQNLGWCYLRVNENHKRLAFLTSQVHSTFSKYMVGFYALSSWRLDKLNAVPFRGGVGKDILLAMRETHLHYPNSSKENDHWEILRQSLICRILVSSRELLPAIFMTPHPLFNLLTGMCIFLILRSQSTIVILG